MARIYPERLPESVLSDPKRQAERRVFHALSGLAQPFVVFYSVAWLARKDGRARDGEADFVIAHPELGILVIEVKGGGVAFDPRSSQWTTTDRFGETYVIDPVEQARRSHHTLLDKLRDLPGWDGSRFLTIGHAVCFPDVIIESRGLKLDLPRELIIDNNDLKDAQSFIVRAFAYWSDKTQRVPLGQDRLATVESLLAYSFRIKTSLAIELDREDERIIELTERQFSLLNMLAMHRRALIAGCAGSGKTMLAVEKARRLHEQGFNVLLTCFNAALAEDLASRLPDVTVMHFHGLCQALAKEAGFLVERAKDLQDYNETVLPNMLMKAIDGLGPMFDAIIVDEGQDFKETYWIALASLLHEKEGIFYVFYDDNQNLYGGTSSLVGIVDETPFLLTENCRNTRAIHRVVRSFYSQPDRLVCNGPDGRTPETTLYRDPQDMLKCLQAALHRLINEERVQVEDVVILTPHAQEKSALKAGTRLGNFVITSNKPERRNGIQATSIHRFKGLERKVVILAEIDSSYIHNPEMLMYVGSSRARTHLLFFIEQDAPAAIRHQIESVCRPAH